MAFIRQCRTCGEKFKFFKNYVVCFSCRRKEVNGYLKEKTMQDMVYNARFEDLEVRVKQLEKLVHYPYQAAQNPNAVIKSQAAQVEATKDLYAPLRSNVDPLIRLSNFARRLLDPHDLGHAVSFEVRELAREALGKEKQG